MRSARYLGGAALSAAGATLASLAVAGPHTFDAGELVAASFTLGGSHPPGQPLHAILGHLAILLPLGSVSFRVSLVSVAGVCVAAWWAGRIAQRLAGEDTPMARVAAVTASAAVLAAAPVARQATRPEVYGPALALTLFAAHEVMAWAGRDRPAGLRRAALASGLAFALHPPHALVAALVGLLWVAVARPDVRFRPRTLVTTALLGILPLLPMGLYLPVRAGAGAPMWGDPTSLRGFVDYVTGKAYAMNVAASVGTSTHHAVTHLLLTAGVASVVGLLALFFADLRRHPLRMALLPPCTVGVALGGAALIPFETQNPDAVAYLAPAVALAVAAGAAGLATLGASRASTLAAALLLAVLAIHPERPGLSHLSRDEPALESLAAALVTTPPPRALTLVESDFAASALILARDVGGARPDIAFLVAGLSTSSWHLRTLASHPLFDGTPIRPRGSPRHGRYVRGAMAHTSGRVAIAVEPDWPTEGRGDLAGPYLLLRPRTEGPRPHVPGPRPLSAIVYGGTLAHGDVPSAIVRNALLTYGRRALARGQIDVAREALASALIDLPKATRDAARRMGAPKRVVPPAVHDPDAFLVSREDAVREVTTLLFASGQAKAAVALLEAQLHRGDPRALLQLSWLHLVSGNRAEAKRVRAALERAAPELTREAEPLDRQLGDSG